MKRLIYYFVCIFILSGCVNTPYESEKVPTIEVTPEEKALIYFSDFFQKGEILSLSSKDTIVSNIWRLYKLGENQEKYLLLADCSDYKAHILYSTGKLKSIIKKGNGPKEINTIGGAFVENGFIYIFDRMVPRLFVYSGNGEFMKTITLPLPSGHYNDFQMIDNNYAVFYKSVPQKLNDYKLSIVDRTNFNIKETLLPQLPPDLRSERHFYQTVFLYSLNDTVCFFQTFSNSVFNVLPDGITTRYSFNFGKYKLPDEIYKNKNLKLGGFADKCINSNYIWNVNDFFETNDYIFFTYNYKKKRFFAFYNKKNGKCISSDEFHDNILTQIIENNISPINFYPIGIIDNSIFFVIESYYLIENLEKIKIQQPLVYNKIIQENTAISQVYKSINMESNPIIIKYCFK